MVPVTITEAELLEAIRAAQARTNDEGLTSEEVAVLLGCTRKLALARLKPLAAQGKLIVGRRRDYRLDGIPCLIPVYSIRD